ncbi:MAG: hypothetical protein IT374_12890 [Polyangiaceae bacterium]|nr:hypothetical protein [Polyangiaceae bacterium]
MTLNDLLLRPETTSEDLGRHLGALSGEARVREATSVARGVERRLWELSAQTAAIRLDEIVADDRAPLDPVPFEGWNNQPLYRAFKKVFYRATDGRLCGYNESDAAWFAGPGYYVLKRDDAGTYVDYTELPSDKPASWPEIQPNTRGMSRFVYGNMKDYLRRVHARVFIGRAYRHGRATHNYFVLARPED